MGQVNKQYRCSPGIIIGEQSLHAREIAMSQALRPQVRIKLAHAPRLNIAGKEKEKEKENPSYYLEKLAFLSLKMACERMGIKV